MGYIRNVIYNVYCWCVGIYIASLFGQSDSNNSSKNKWYFNKLMVLLIVHLYSLLCMYIVYFDSINNKILGGK